MPQKIVADNTAKKWWELNLMRNREHVVVAYGKELGYHHGAKFQILSAWERWYSNPDASICVVTDKPEIFDGYPVRILEITERHSKEWSLNGLQHFGIKLKAFEYAMGTSKASVSMLLDTDTYWIRNPEPLAEQIGEGQALMFCDEGLVRGSRNKSINRFNEALTDQYVIWGGGMTYELTSKSRMLNSSIIGLHQRNIGSIERAFHLFSSLEPLVNAHTVEQFALGETFRMEKVNVKFGASYTRDWSSTGRKNYATPVLQKFFQKYGENDFLSHLKYCHKIAIRRPTKVFLQQKLTKFWNPN